MSNWDSVKIMAVKVKLRLFATRLNVNCRQIMMKRPHSCASATGPHRVSSCNAVPMNQAAARPRGDGRVAATTTPATRAICYFALSATRSLIKRPLRVVRPQHFSSLAAAYDIPRLARPSCTPLFFSLSPLLTFLLPREPAPAPCPSRTNAPRRSGKSESDGISSKPLHVLPGDSLLWEKFVLLRRETQILYYKETFLNIGSECCYALCRRFLEKVSSWYSIGTATFPNACANEHRFHIFHFISFVFLQSSSEFFIQSLD